jgi:hypothetical protein
MRYLFIEFMCFKHCTCLDAQNSRCVSSLNADTCVIISIRCMHDTSTTPTDWTSEFIGDPALEKYTAKTENGEIVALGAYRETESSMFVYIEYIESHPESNPTLTIQKKYLGIGRMMIAFGIQLSIDSGKNGVVTFEAKTDELAKS